MLRDSMPDRDGPDTTAEQADDAALEMVDSPERPEDRRAASADEDGAASGTERPKKKKRKSKRKKRPADGEADAEAADAKAKDAPLPGAGTPDGTKLREAHRLFDAGDYARVRARCRELRASDVPGVRDGAEELYTRTTVDPVQVVVMLACTAVLGAIVWVWMI